jgi:ankyrin repeat protein
MLVVCSKLNGPEMQLRTLRVVPENAAIFRLAIAGDVDGIKVLFHQGRASIYDIDNTRWSILHKAFLNGQRRVCRFLLEQGADSTLEAANGSSVVERAWYFDRTNTGYTDFQDDFLHDILGSVDFDSLAESQQYTTIHKIVLGLSNLDLEAQLQHSTSAIDAADARGRSALWWASARGDSTAVSTLLEYGAAFDDRDGVHSAFHVAQTPAVVKLLVSHGARIDCRDEQRRTPLHCCAYRGPSRGGSFELLECLLECGADIHAQTIAGHTALHYAAQFGLLEHAELLVAKGAALEARKLTGRTPLLEAVSCGRLEMVRFLLDSGAELGAKNANRRSVLHLVAERGNVLTMECLGDIVDRGCIGRVGRLGVDVDVEAVDAFGMTPRGVFEQRMEKDVLQGDEDAVGRLKGAFERMMDVFQECAGGSNKGGDGHGDDGEDEEAIFTPVTDSGTDSDEDEENEVFEDASQ